MKGVRVHVYNHVNARAVPFLTNLITEMFVRLCRDERFCLFPNPAFDPVHLPLVTSE